MARSTVLWLAALLVSAAVIGTHPTPRNAFAGADVALAAPVAAGQTLTVVHGYNDPLPGEPCAIGSAVDHCGSQRYGLDLAPSNTSDHRVLAPLPGRVAWIEGNCLGLTTQDNLNLNVCHFDTFAVGVGTSVSRGDVLGNRSTPWIHLSLDDRNRDDRNKPPVPFNGSHTIAGVSFDPDNGIRNTHNGETISSGSPASSRLAEITNISNGSPLGIAVIAFIGVGAAGFLGYRRLSKKVAPAGPSDDAP